MMRERSSCKAARMPRCSSPRPVHRLARVCSTRLPPSAPSKSTSSKPFYELEDAVLTAGYPLGVSNEYAEGSSRITVSTRQGALVVVETIAD